MVSILTTPNFICAQDWPQLLGSQRNGQAEPSTTLARPWEKTPAIAWKVALGSGFSGVAISDGRVIAFHRQQDKEALTAYDLQSGEELWNSSWPATYRGRIDPDEGPRTVPLVHAGKVYAYGASGELACAALADGQLKWKRALRQEYSADDGYFGAGSSPIIIGDKVIVCVGGKAASVVAVDRQTGKTLWTCGTEDASYASPIQLPSRDGKERLLAVMRLETLLIDAQAGKVLSQVSFGSRGPTVNAATPLSTGHQTYLLTASYGVGSLLLSVANDQLSELQRSSALSSQYNTPTLAGGRLVGIDGREDIGVASLKALDPQTLKPLWEQTNFGTAHLIAVANVVLSLNIDGQLKLIDPTQSVYTELAGSQLPAGKYRALPALSNQRLLVRRTLSATKSELLCIELPR